MEYQPRGFSFIEKKPQKTDRSRRIQLNAITQEEKQTVINYAITHTEFNHREITFRMIDEDIAFMSTSSVHRILRETNLLQHRQVKARTGKWPPHASLAAADELWQTDLMALDFDKRSFYLLSYLDVFLCYLVHHEVCLSMAGDTIRHASQRAIEQTGRKPKVIQSDNGSCYISPEDRSFIKKLEIEHRQMHPHCPNENAEIERYHRTVRELVDPSEADEFAAFLELVKEQIQYYNYERYHSAIGYATPYAKYIGKAEAILSSRQKKLQKAKERRIKTNLERITNKYKVHPKKAA